MASLTADNSPTGCHPTQRRPSRWWLAGLLVGCLLPAGLAQVESLRPVERAVQICILAPALIRASSLLRARRWSRVRRAFSRRGAVRAQHAPTRRWPAPLRRSVAAHDVLTRRGPPSAPRR